MRKSVMACFGVLALAASLPAQTTCLSTLFARNNGGSNGGAVYLDVNVLNPNGITIESYETNTLDLVAFGFDVYITPVTRVGNETNSGLWTLVASGNGVGLGANIPTPIDTTDFSLAPGTYGMALVMSAAAGHDYTNGTGSNEFFSNADLELSLGGASNTPFTAGIFQPRIWNGTICYREQAECFLLLGGRPANINLGSDILLVEPIILLPMTLTNFPSLSVPPIQGLVGVSVYVQGLLWNPQAFPLDPLKVSAGLEYEIGIATTAYGAETGLSIWPLGANIAQPGGQITIGFTIN